MRVLGGGSTKESRVVGAGDCEGVAERHPDAKSSKVVETEDAIEADAEEPAPVRVARDPGDPTSREREHHNATHIPYRSWCPVCVKAKGKEETHVRRNDYQSLKPTVSYDYK